MQPTTQNKIDTPAAQAILRRHSEAKGGREMSNVEDWKAGETTSVSVGPRLYAFQAPWSAQLFGRAVMGDLAVEAGIEIRVSVSQRPEQFGS